MKNRYVQHLSGQGKKWKLCDAPYNTSESEQRADWMVIGDTDTHYVPKSEYRLVYPPTSWEPCTHECTMQRDMRGLVLPGGPVVLLPIGYRWQWWPSLPANTLIVQREVEG